MLTVHSGHDIRLLNLPTKAAIKQALNVAAEEKLEGVRRMFNRYYEVRQIFCQQKLFYTQSSPVKLFTHSFLLAKIFSNFQRVKAGIAKAKAIEKMALSFHLLDQEMLDRFVEQLGTLTGPLEEVKNFFSQKFSQSFQDLAKAEVFLKSTEIKTEPVR